MRRCILALPVLCLLLAAAGGKTLRISSPDFSFLVDEPEGWMIDLQTAAQVAHFVVHRQEETWRSANLVVFARFLPRLEEETLEAFITEDEGRFLANCGTGLSRKLDWDLESRHDFQIRAYDCMGLPEEIVAVASLPSHFAVFSLSSPRRSPLDEGVPKLKELVKSFQWMGKPSKAEPPAGFKPGP